MPFDEVALAMAQWQLGRWLPAADVQKLAIRLLEEGRSSPALYELAGTPAFALGQDLHGLVEQMFAELDLQLPTYEEATLLLVQQIADDIVDGRIRPYEGAQEIWWLSSDLDDINRRAVDAFVVLASRDDLALTEGERQIKEAAVRFLAEQAEAERRVSFEARARNLLVGLRPVAVRYIEVDSSERMYDRQAEFDSLAFGLELVGEDGRVVGLEWSDDFDTFGIAVVDGALERQDAVWDVSDRNHWKSLLGREVTQISVAWGDVPWALTMHFGDQRVWVAALEVDSDVNWLGRLFRADRWWGADNITVVFDEGVARRLRLP